MASSLFFLVLVAQVVSSAWASIRSVGLRGDRPWHPRLQRARLPEGAATLVKISMHDSEEDGGDHEPPSLLQVQSSSSESNCPCPRRDGVSTPLQANAAQVQAIPQAPASQSFMETSGSIKVQQANPAPHVFTQVQQVTQQQPQAQSETGPAANSFAPVSADFGQMQRSVPVSFQQSSQEASQPPGTATVRLTAVQQNPQNFQQQQVSVLQQQMQEEQIQLQNQMLYLQKMQQAQQETPQMQSIQQVPQQMMQQMPQMPQQMAVSQMPEQMPQQQMPMALPQMQQQMMQMPQQMQQQMPQQMMQTQQMPINQMAFAQMPQQMQQQVSPMMQQMPQMMQQMPQQMPPMGQMQPMVFMEGVPPVQQQEPARMPMVQYPMQYNMQYMR